MYPAPSDFRAAGPHAWWLVSKDGTRRVCQMSGYSFVRLLQQTLRESILPGSPTYEGGTIAGNQVGVDGRIGVTTLRALWAAAHFLGASPEGLDIIRDEALAAPSAVTGATMLGHNVMLMAIWVLARLGVLAGVPEEVSTDDIMLPLDATLPYWGAAPPMTPVERAYCTVLSAGPGPSPDDGGKPDGSNPILGPDKTPPVLGLPTGRSPRRDTTISPAVLVGGLALVGLTVLAVVVTNKSERGGRSGARRRARANPHAWLGPLT